MLIVATGDGKGKTTAAIGQAIRALGHGKRVFFAQFIKCDNYPSGEDSMLRNFPGQLTFLKGGKGFVGICGDRLPFEEHRSAAQKALAAAREAALSGMFNLLILDEINVALALHLLAMEEVDDFLRVVPVSANVMFTGRGADPKIIERADFVTECKEIKHPFHQHVAAQEGVEY